MWWPSTTKKKEEVPLPSLWVRQQYTEICLCMYVSVSVCVYVCQWQVQAEKFVERRRKSLKFRYLLKKHKMFVLWEEMGEYLNWKMTVEPKRSTMNLLLYLNSHCRLWLNWICWLKIFHNFSCAWMLVISPFVSLLTCMFWISYISETSKAPHLNSNDLGGMYSEGD